MPGPPPKHPSVRARRNNAKSDFTTLRPDERDGKPTPPWPLGPDVMSQARVDVARDRQTALMVEIEGEEDGRKRGKLKRDLAKVELVIATLTLQIEQARDTEVALWSELWAMPQASIWEQSHAGREVAQYVRWKIRAEQGDSKAAVEARLLSDRLGLNPLALLRLRVEIERAEEAETRGKTRRTRAAPKSGKDDPRGGLFAVS